MLKFNLTPGEDICRNLELLETEEGKEFNRQIKQLESEGHSRKDIIDQLQRYCAGEIYLKSS